jgi:thiol-disulfide isomerase/thioredoxin
MQKAPSLLNFLGEGESVGERGLFNRGARDREMEQTAAELIQCTKCGANNRIPLERINSQAKCGRCHAPLPMGDHDGRGTNYVIRCSECAAKNRLHSHKLGDHPKCAKCGARLRAQELLEPQPILITDHDFPDKVLKSALPVLVFAMSPTCPSCTMVAPSIEAIARKYKGRLKVGRLNVQTSPNLAAKFDILSVPYLLVFDRGQLLESSPGALHKGQIEALVSRHLY